MKLTKTALNTALFSLAISHSAFAIDQLKNKEMIITTYVAAQDQDDQSQAKRQQNRRVEIKLIK